MGLLKYSPTFVVPAHRTTPVEPFMKTVQFNLLLHTLFIWSSV